MFKPDTSIKIEDFYGCTVSFTREISPLRTKSRIKEKSVESYVIRKKREFVSSFSDATACKLRKIYDVNDVHEKVVNEI